MPLAEELQALLTAFPGEVGIVLENLATSEGPSAPGWRRYSGERFCYQETRPFPAASTIKLPMLCYALSTGADLEQKISIRPETVGLGSGILKELSPGLALPLRDLLTLMIVLSDNTATNVVLDFFGHKEPFNAYYQAQGWLETHTAVKGHRPPAGAGTQGMLSLPENRPDPKREKGDFSRTSARDQAAILKALWWGELPQAQTALDILSRQQFTSFLRYLPIDLDALEEGTPPLKLYSKSGEIRCCRHDAGILAKGDQAVVMAVLTESESDPRFHPDHPAILMIGRIAAVVYRHWLG